MVAARYSISRVLSQTQTSSYICRSCRNQLSRVRIPIQQRRFASNPQEPLSTTQTAEHKKWSAVDSPSLSDSYNKSELSGKKIVGTLAERDGEEIEAQDKGVGAAAYEAPTEDTQNVQSLSPIDDMPEEYQPAETWEGLQSVGSSGNWRDMPATAEDDFSTWLGTDSQVARSRQELVSCLRQALIEHESALLASSTGDINVDDSFLQLKLDMEDPLSFEVLKRFSQFSGHRIPDPTLNTISSSNKPLSFLVDQLFEQVVQPKPTKVADILMNSAALSSQSNVLIFSRRETSIDKEKEVGRWKVIERELRDRGLPVTGRLKQL